MLEECIGDSEIPFGVFEIDRIHLVRHDRGAGLALDRTLAKIPDRNVTPHIAAETEQNRIDARSRRADLRDKIVALDLGGQRIPDQAEALDEGARLLDPIDFGIREIVRIEIADRAVELPEILLRLQMLQ